MPLSRHTRWHPTLSFPIVTPYSGLLGAETGFQLVMLRQEMGLTVGPVLIRCLDSEATRTYPASSANLLYCTSYPWSHGGQEIGGGDPTLRTLHKHVTAIYYQLSV
jgi:hypothetical protein